MKKTETILNNGCKGGSECPACSRCNMVSYEERNFMRAEIKNQPAQLYAAELQHYDFYFFQTDHRATR